MHAAFIQSSTSQQPKAKDAAPSLGRLKSLGVTEDYLAPFLFPKRYNDIRRENIILDFPRLESFLTQKVYIGCALHESPVLQANATPTRLRFIVKDRQGYCMKLIVFGAYEDCRVLSQNLQAARSFCLRGEVSEWNGEIQLKNVEWIDPCWIGKIQPVYPGKTKVINPETVLKRMTELVGLHIDKSVMFLQNKFLRDDLTESSCLKVLGDGEYENFKSLINNVHTPKTVADGIAAQALLRRLAALELAEKMNQTAAVMHNDSRIAIDRSVVKLPNNMTLTRDQDLAIDEIFADISSDKPMKRLLTGDVGTGKSIPIAIAAAGVAKSGGNSIILMPNEPLAEQMRRDIDLWWPDLEPKLVANSTKGLPESRILVGTTALNFRIPDDYPVNLLIIDEQQKMSVEQRTKLARPYTNILEASATPLPRSLALIKYGGLPISTLRQAYVKKTISTRMVFNEKQQKRELFENVKEIIRRGYQALIIYPLAESTETDEVISEETKKADLKSAEGAFEVWQKHFPGRVRFAHGKQKSEEKLANISALKNDEADILCSTTVVEVGLNVPKLRFVVIVHPERLGLSTLHQIRGRLCRNGGEGWCVLYFPAPVAPKTMTRLKVFEKTNDGFRIAMEDMKLRGMGDLVQTSENEQSGHIDVSFLPGQKLAVEDFEWAIAMHEKLYKHDNNN